MRSSFLLSTAVTLLFAASTTLAQQPSSIQVPEDLVPVHAHRSSTPLPELANQWWQWAFSMPPSLSPLHDEDGQFCQIGQIHKAHKGDVLFLAGGPGGHSTHRECTISHRQAILIPILNIYMSHDPRSHRVDSCDHARQWTALQNTQVSDLIATVDGVESQDIHSLNAETCFDLFGGRSPRFQGAPAYPTATAGRWLFLKPLKKGHHVLHVAGSYLNKDGSTFFMDDTTYDLTVE